MYILLLVWHIVTLLLSHGIILCTFSYYSRGIILCTFSYYSRVIDVILLNLFCMGLSYVQFLIIVSLSDVRLSYIHFIFIVAYLCTFSYYSRWIILRPFSY